jgi:hypothetical protein
MSFMAGGAGCGWAKGRFWHYEAGGESFLLVMLFVGAMYGRPVNWRLFMGDSRWCWCAGPGTARGLILAYQKSAPGQF